MFVLIAGLSVAAMAQKEDPKKLPPKGTPPVVNPRVDKPPKNDPQKPKKPGMEALILLRKDLGESA